MTDSQRELIARYAENVAVVFSDTRPNKSAMEQALTQAFTDFADEWEGPARGITEAALTLGATVK